MLEICEKQYGNWGRCVCLSDGKIEMLITLDFGPRIISFGPVGGENILFEDKEDKSNAYAYKEASDKLFGAESGVWHIYGGHRLWVSPESVPETYYPDNEPVDYKKIENGIILTPPPQKGVNFQLSMEITMEKDNSFKIIHKVQNIDKVSKTYAPWALTVMSQNGTAVVPVPTRETGLIENRHLVLWPYTKMTDPRVTWGDKYIVLKQDPENEDKFKLGQLSQHGWIAYFNHGGVFVKKFDINEDEKHPDRNCNTELFTSSLMLEAESIGVYGEVAPNMTAIHTEYWSYFCSAEIPANEAEMDTFAEKFI